MTDSAQHGARPGDERFFHSTGPHGLQRIAEVAGAAPVTADYFMRGLAPLQTAEAGDVSFLDNRKYADLLRATRAGAVIVHPDLAADVPAGVVALVTTEPYVGWARVTALFYPPVPARPGVHPRAVVDVAARVDAGAEVGPGAVIAAGAVIGPGCIIGPLAVIGQGVVLGAGCRIGAQVTITHAVLGRQVVVLPGARIGQDGFGFAITKSGFVPVQQLGKVVIGDGVEIGANTTIDRGSAQDTVIGDGVHIDNLVQLGHNVNIGPGTVIVAQAGVSGSTQIGAGVMIAAQAGLTGHLMIGDRARIGAQAGVMADVEAGLSVIGAPAQPAARFFREVATLRKMVAAWGKSGKKADADG